MLIVFPEEYKVIRVEKVIDLVGVARDPEAAVRLVVKLTCKHFGY